jgi:hypothetical protein
MWSQADKLGISAMNSGNIDDNDENHRNGKYGFSMNKLGFTPICFVVFLL